MFDIGTRISSCLLYSMAKRSFSDMDGTFDTEQSKRHLTIEEAQRRTNGGCMASTILRMNIFGKCKLSDIKSALNAEIPVVHEKFNALRRSHGMVCYSCFVYIYRVVYRRMLMRVDGRVSFRSSRYYWHWVAHQSGLFRSQKTRKISEEANRIETRRMCCVGRLPWRDVHRWWHPQSWLLLQPCYQRRVAVSQRLFRWHRQFLAPLPTRERPPHPMCRCAYIGYFHKEPIHGWPRSVLSWLGCCVFCCMVPLCIGCVDRTDDGSLSKGYMKSFSRVYSVLDIEEGCIISVLHYSSVYWGDVCIGIIWLIIGKVWTSSGVRTRFCRYAEACWFTEP